MGNEELVAITHNFQGEAIFTIPMVKEERSKGFGSEARGSGNNSDIGTGPAGHGNNHVETRVRWEQPNEVDCDAVATTVGNGERVQGTSRLKRERFVMLAQRAGGQETMLKIRTHLWLVVRILQRHIAFVSPKMTERIIGQQKECFVNHSDIRDHKSIRDVQESISQPSAINATQIP